MKTDFSQQISFILTLIITSVYCDECPKPEILKPCVCNPLTITISCGGEEAIDLKTYFHRLSSELSDGKKHFKQFYLNNTAISELAENTFENITFDSIEIRNASNFSLINTKAFTAIDLHLQEIHIENTSLRNSPPDHDIFAAISSMPKMERITIDKSKIDEIPDNAFGPNSGQQKKLWFVALAQNNISKIGNNAFQYMESMEQLYLFGNKIEHISQNAFHFSKKSDKYLQIDLSFSLSKNSSLEIGVFDNLMRPMNLILENFELQYLEQRIFEPFCDNIKNGIQSKTIDCEDCRSFWLFKNRKCNPRTEDIKCSNYRQFYDSNNFKNCSEFYEMK